MAVSVRDYLIESRVSEWLVGVCPTHGDGVRRSRCDAARLLLDIDLVRCTDNHPVGHAGCGIARAAERRSYRDRPDAEDYFRGVVS
jgi:hypothetical protein